MLVADPAVAGGERTKLLDFGIAKLRDPNLRKNLTKGDSLLGTPAYMSPEQCRGGVEVSDRSDVYALGVILYRLLAGRLPFLATGGGELLGMHQFQAPTPLASVASYVPESVVALIVAMMTKDPALRPSMAEVDQRIGVLQSELAGFVQPSLSPHEGDPGDSSDDDEHEGVTVDASHPSALLPENLVFAPLVTPMTPNSPDSSVPSRPMGLDEFGSAGNRSTMNMLASENSSPPSRFSNSRSSLLWVLIPVSLLGASVGALLLGRPGQKPTGDVTATGGNGGARSKKVDHGTKTDTPAHRVHWELRTTPVSAEIMRISDGAVLGRTPWQSELIAAPGSQELRIVAPGYADRLVVLDQSRDEQQTLKLDPVSGLGTPSAGTPSAVGPTGKGSQKAFKGDAQKKKKKPQFEIEE